MIDKPATSDFASAIFTVCHELRNSGHKDLPQVVVACRRRSSAAGDEGWYAARQWRRWSKWRSARGSNA